MTPYHPKHITAPPRAIRRPPTPTQRKRRNAYRTCSRYYHNLLTAHQRTLWCLYAFKHPTPTEAGRSIHPSGFMVFLRINLTRVFNSQPILPEPPD